MILSASQREWALKVAAQRQAQATREGRPNVHGLEADTQDAELRKHELGALGELAAALAYGIPWPAHLGEYKRVGRRRGKPDLPPDFEVRTRSQLGYQLIVRADDLTSRRFILVHADGDNFLVRGHILGGDAKRQEWLQSHGGREPAYFVPTGALTPPPGSQEAEGASRAEAHNGGICPRCGAPGFRTLQIDGLLALACAEGCLGRKIKWPPLAKSSRA